MKILYVLKSNKTLTIKVKFKNIGLTKISIARFTINLFQHLSTYFSPSNMALQISRRYSFGVSNHTFKQFIE